MNNKIYISTTDTLTAEENTDAALLRGTGENDLCAFEQIYHRWNRHVYGFMLKTTRSVSDSEDITQEVFVRLWKMRGQIDPQKKIQSLIFTIARRIAVDMYRRNDKIGIVYSSPEDGPCPEMSPQEILEDRETSLLLDIAIENMPKKQRRVFSLYYYRHLSQREIAAELGLTYENVRKHIYNGKRQLCEILSLVALFLMGKT